MGRIFLLKRPAIWVLILMVVFFDLSFLLGSPKIAKAANYTGSTFTAKSDGTLVHTYTVDGVKKTQTFSGQTADTGTSVYKNGSSFINTPLYIYKMDSSEIHKNWGANCRENANIQPKTSPYYLVVRKVNDTYETVGVYFKQQCTNADACGMAGYNILTEEYYFQAQNFSRNGDDCEGVYNKGSDFYGYLTYLNSRNFSVNGISTGQQSDPCTISGSVSIDFSKQNLTGTETGTMQWSELKKKQYFGDLEFYAQLWYKGPGAAAFISAEEKTLIQSDGSYTFEKKARPTGTYVVTATVKRTKNAPSFSTATIDPAFENQKLDFVDPSFFPAFSDQGDLEYFFGKSALIEIAKSCKNFTGQDVVMSSIGIQEKKGSEADTADTCGVDVGLNVFARAIGGALCALRDMMASFIEWIVGTLYQYIFNA